MKTVDDDRHPVIFVEIEILLERIDHTMGDIRVVADGTDVKVLVVVDKTNHCSFTRRCARIWTLLDEIADRNRLAPGRLFKLPVQGDLFRDPGGSRDSR